MPCGMDLLDVLPQAASGDAGSHRVEFAFAPALARAWKRAAT